MTDVEDPLPSEPSAWHDRFKAWLDAHGRTFSTAEPGDLTAWRESEGRTSDEWVEEVVETQRLVSTPVQVERGQYLDHFATIDWNIGMVFTLYFEIPSERVAEFKEWVIGNMPIGRRIEVLGAIVEARGLQKDFGKLAQRLKAANEIRNVLAHAVLSAGESESWFQSWKYKRGQLPQSRFTLEELRQQVRRAAALNWQVSRLMDAVTGQESPFAGTDPFSDVEF